MEELRFFKNLVSSDDCSFQFSYFLVFWKFFALFSFLGMLGKRVCLIIEIKAMAFGSNGDFVVEQSSIILNKHLSLLDPE